MHGGALGRCPFPLLRDRSRRGRGNDLVCAAGCAAVLRLGSSRLNLRRGSRMAGSSATPVPEQEDPAVRPGAPQGKARQGRRGATASYGA
jgi:hypothetical protein